MQVIPVICFLCGSGRSAGVNASSTSPHHLSYFQGHYSHLCDARLPSKVKPQSVCVVPLTHDIEPLLPMRLRQDDAHHLSDAVCFYDSKVDVWLDEHDWFRRGRREGDPLDVESSGG